MQCKTDVAHKFPIESLDTASYSLKCGVDLLNALHTAIDEGPFKAEDYKDALFAAWSFLDDVSREISSCINDYYEQCKKEKEENDYE